MVNVPVYIELRRLDSNQQLAFNPFILAWTHHYSFTFINKISKGRLHVRNAFPLINSGWQLVTSSTFYQTLNSTVPAWTHIRRKIKKVGWRFVIRFTTSTICLLSSFLIWRPERSLLPKTGILFGINSKPAPASFIEFKHWHCIFTFHLGHCILPFIVCFQCKPNQ